MVLRVKLKPKKSFMKKYSIISLLLVISFSCSQEKISNKYATIFFGNLKNKNHKKLNISFITKKKIGNAEKRNKIKRRLRNIMNEMIQKI